MDGKQDLSRGFGNSRVSSEEQRESLMDIVRRRLIEERRDRLAHSIN